MHFSPVSVGYSDTSEYDFGVWNFLAILVSIPGDVQSVINSICSLYSPNGNEFKDVTKNVNPQTDFTYKEFGSFSPLNTALSISELTNVLSAILLLNP